VRKVISLRAFYFAATILQTAYRPHDHAATDSVVDFLFSTILVFGYLIYFYRTLLKQLRFWLALLVVLLVHTIVYVFALEMLGPWRSLVSVTIAVFEIAVLIWLLSSLFGPRERRLKS
jgi:hypothetical protein